MFGSACALKYEGEEILLFEITDEGWLARWVLWQWREKTVCMYGMGMVWYGMVCVYMSGWQDGWDKMRWVTGFNDLTSLIGCIRTAHAHAHPRAHSCLVGYLVLIIDIAPREPTNWLTDWLAGWTGITDMQGVNVFLFFFFSFFPGTPPMCLATQAR